MKIKSHGHLFFARQLDGSIVELFIDQVGDLFRAPLSNVLVLGTGYRFARFECPSRLASQAVKVWAQSAI